MNSPEAKVDSIVTRDEARKLFWDAGLDYETVLTQANLQKLCDFLDEASSKEEEKCNAATKNGLGLYYWKRTIRKTAVPLKSITHSGPVCFIQASGCYFERRECISFNGGLDDSEEHKWIGFCGDADQYNASIVTGAFKEWVEWVKRREAEDPTRTLLSALAKLSKHLSPIPPEGRADAIRVHSIPDDGFFSQTIEGLTENETKALSKFIKEAKR